MKKFQYYTVIIKLQKIMEKKNLFLSIKFMLSPQSQPRSKLQSKSRPKSLPKTNKKTKTNNQP